MVDLIQSGMSWRISWFRGLHVERPKVCSRVFPVDDSWAGSQLIRRKIAARKILSVTIPLLLLGLLIPVFAPSTPFAPMSPLEMFGMICVSLGIVGTAIGFAWPHIEQPSGARDAVPVEAINGGYVRMSGVDPDYLATLPHWDGEPVVPDRTGFWGALKRGWPIQVALVVVATIYIVYVNFILP